MKSGIFSVVSTMKNEGPYILDWVAHYKALGFDHVMIASNDCTDPTDAILDRLQELGHIFHHYTIERNGGIQRSAVRQSMSRDYPEIHNSEWVFICDADEYLNVHVGDHDVASLVYYSGAFFEAVVVPWRNFAPNGEVEISDLSVTKQFRVGELPYDKIVRPKVGKFTKSLVRNRKKFKRMGLHMPVMHKDRDNSDIRFVLPGGIDYYNNGAFQYPEISFELAQVNHYALKSLSAYLVKRDRGRANHSNHVLGVSYWERFNLEGEIDTTIDRYDEAKQVYLDQFMSDPQLRDLHFEALAWHRNKAKEMISDPKNRKLLRWLKRLNHKQVTYSEQKEVL